MPNEQILGNTLANQASDFAEMVMDWQHAGCCKQRETVMAPIQGTVVHHTETLFLALYRGRANL
jgi:hypothetical protein